METQYTFYYILLFFLLEVSIPLPMVVEVLMPLILMVEVIIDASTSGGGGYDASGFDGSGTYTSGSGIGRPTSL